MDDERINRASGDISDSNLRFTFQSALVIVAFAVIHFVVGVALILAWMKFWSSQIIATLGWILVNIWWFPAQQIYQLHHSNDHISWFAFPVCNSLLWGAIVFVIWKARHGKYFRFSLRALLVGTTLVALTLGMIIWLTK